jgi:hypothetical protein
VNILLKGLLAKVYTAQNIVALRFVAGQRPRDKQIYNSRY